MKRGLELALVALLAISVIASACAPAAQAPVQAPAPTKAPEAIKPASEPTKAPAPAAAKAPDSAKPAAEAAKPAAAKPPIKIGFLAPMTGPNAQGGFDPKDALAMFLDEKGGSLAGRKIEVIVEDDEMNAQVGLVKAKKLVERDNVHMLAGVASSAVAYALVDYVKSKKIPLLVLFAGADDLTQRQFTPYIFRTFVTNSQMEYPLGEWAYKKGYRKSAIIAADYAAGIEGAGGFARVFTEAGGRVIQEQYKPLGSPDAAPFVTAINPDADVVFAYQFDVDAMRFVPTYEEYGMKKRFPLIGNSGLASEAILPRQGDSALGVVTAQVWTAALDNAANKTFMAAYEKRYSRTTTGAAVYGYEGGKILDKALLAVNGNIEDTDGFIKALEKVEIPDSPRGQVKFDKYHSAVISIYLAETRKVDGKLANVIMDTYKDVSQFWKWNPDDYLKMPTYTDLKGKWAK